MKWIVQHDLTLCGEVLLQEPFKHPKNSKERGEVWSNIAVSLNSLENPSFKVSKRSVRDRLTLLQTKYKGKIREEEKASGIDCEETPPDAAIEEILEKEKAAHMERNEQSGTQTLKEQREKASAEEVRRQAMERLGKTQKRNADSEEGKPSKKEREEAQMLLNISKGNSSWKVSSGGKKWISGKLRSRCWWTNRVKCTSSS